MAKTTTTTDATDATVEGFNDTANAMANAVASLDEIAMDFAPDATQPRTGGSTGGSKREAITLTMPIATWGGMELITPFIMGRRRHFGIRHFHDGFKRHANGTATFTIWNDNSTYRGLIKDQRDAAK